MSHVDKAFHRSFEEDMGLLIGTSFIIHYLDWQARRQFLVGLSVTATNHSGGFRPIRFLHPGPFLGTDRDQRQKTCILAARDHRSPLSTTLLSLLSHHFGCVVEQISRRGCWLQLASGLVNRFNPLLLRIRGRQLGLTGKATPCSYRWRIVVQLLFLN
jgi:hypothetical protein